MSHPPLPQRNRPSLTLLFLALFVVITGSAAAYLFIAETTPAWLSALIPSSRYQLSEAEEPPGEEQTALGGAQKEPPRQMPVSVKALPQEAAQARPGASPKAAAEQDRRGPAPAPEEQAGGKSPAPPADQSAPLPSSSQAIPGMAEFSSPSPEKNSETSTPSTTSPEKDKTAPPGRSAPVIVYGKAKPASPGSGVMRGSISQPQALMDQGSPHAALPASGQGPSSTEDSVVPLAFVHDLAGFLASNFWPAGTHPMAKDKAISTASVKWANIKYGVQMHGFNAPPAQEQQARARVLNYAFTPSMLNALYTLYSQRFLEKLDKEAHAQLRGESNLPLGNSQLADMYELYADIARSLAEAIRAYMGTPDARTLVAAYSMASLEANESYRAFSTAVEEATGNEADSARAYQEAIMNRERKREDIAAALRRYGAVRVLDADSLVYTAQWLYRRGPGKEDCFRALASVLDACAAQMHSIGGRYRNMRDAPETVRDGGQ